MKLTKEYLKKLDQKLELIPLSYDIAFKSTFKTNLNLLKHILNATLPIEISKEDKINLLDSEMPIINKKEHEQIVDIFVVINKNIFIDIEMNRSKFESVLERNIRYMNIISNRIFEKGESIKDLKDKYIFQINLNANPYEDVLDDIIVLYGLLTKKIYSSNERTIVKGLERYRDLYYNESVKSKEVIWYTVLTARTFSELYELALKVLEEDKVQRLMEAVINMSNDDFILHEWQKDKMDALVKYNEIEAAKSDGIKEGIQSRNIQIVKKMLTRKMNIEDISEITGLTKEEIQKLENTEN